MLGVSELKHQYKAWKFLKRQEVVVWPTQVKHLLASLWLTMSPIMTKQIGLALPAPGWCPFSAYHNNPLHSMFFSTLGALSKPGMKIAGQEEKKNHCSLCPEVQSHTIKVQTSYLVLDWFPATLETHRNKRWLIAPLTSLIFLSIVLIKEDNCAHTHKIYKCAQPTESASSVLESEENFREFVETHWGRARPMGSQLDQQQLAVLCFISFQ